MSGETHATAADLFAAEERRGAGRKLDERATRIARARHERGVEKMNAAFGVLPGLDDDGKLMPPPRNVMAALVAAHEFGDPGGRGRPVRLKAGCPPVRDAEHQARHERRKRSRASRKANRG